ncbi:hypothetical protein QTP86_034097, partial [Hemibagrus guttatus]
GPRPGWLEEVRQRALKDATKMAMNGRNEDALYENADYCDIYNLQHVPYGSSSGYFARIQGKGRELADVMERRKVDILCVQETRWKGSKARSIGAGFKLFYYGVDSKRNGVGVVLKEEFVRNVLEVKRVSDRVMSLKLEFEGVMLNVVSGYAPQVGCELEEKERFWSELDEVMESIPTGERVVIGADFNGHVGEGNTGDEEVMGKFGVKERNLEGQMVVDFAKRMDMGVVNTYFQKREEHRVTYKSGGRRTQVDYILCRRGNLKEISDCKVVVGESVARQHRMVVCRMTLMVCKTKRSEIEKKTKWWKLKKEECCEEFRQKSRQALSGQVVLPDDWETTAEVIKETGRKVLGVSSGRRKEDKETWWWNEEVQDSIQRKRLAKKKWDMDRTEENRQEYKELQRRVKREVSKAKQKAYEELYTRLDTREGEKDLYRLARQRDRDGKDVQQVRVIKDRDGRVLTSEESVQRRWKEYFEELMNEENEREKRVEGVNSVEQKVDKIRKDEVRKALKRMKSGKAVGPDDIPVEVWKCLGEAAVEFLANLFNRVLESERMPEEWRRSVLVPIFKNKGDVQSCSNYRGIKLMSHTMKVWERVVEARLRKVVEICEQQYGFMPRKSTTDAIFALRILMEKYRDGQKELHCVFVDLEKAYDRVPREELWYCMRKSGVAEKYVRVVQDMYERSRTVVRCAVGQTEEFKVEVGLHQGSALSPFLFAMVMDQLSEEVRQESPWTMMFADDIVICSESREQVEENLERWRFALERRGMKVSRSKTEYMCVNEREGSETVRLQGEEVKKVQEFKYLGSTVQSNGECGKEVKKRVQAGWNGWRKVSGVLCDQKISARIKGKVYRTVVRAAMLYGLETVSLRKRQESELEVAELKMLRFSLGVTRLDRIRNEYIRGTAHVGRLGDKVREARLRWFGHVQRRDSPECVLKPPLNLMGQHQPEPFQPISPAQTLGPAPVLMPPDPLAFPLCSPLSAKPPPHLQLFPNPAITAPLGSSPIPTENEFQATVSDQDTALEELCRPLYCKLCNVTLNSPQQAQAHYQGKNHSKKLRNFYAGSQQPPPIRIPEEGEPVSQQSLSTPPTETGTTVGKPLQNSSSLQLEVTNLPIYQSGKGYKAISKALGLPQTTVRAIIYKWRKHGTVENLPRSGRPTKITSRVQRQLIQEVTKDPTTTSKELQASLASVKASFIGPSRVILATENDYCKLCDASFSSPAVAHAHYQGKNHAKRVRLAEAQHNASSLDAADLTQRRSRKEGNEYKLKNRRTHMNTTMPVKSSFKQEEVSGPYYNPRPRQRIPRDLAMCVTPSGQFYCSMCNTGASDEADFRLHLESKHHKSKVSEQRYRSEMENLGYT